MSKLLHCRQCRLPIVLVLILCLVLPSAAAGHLKDTYTSLVESPFSVLVLGDSQMAGAGWDEGYVNCILEAYPNAKILNLAQSGSLLANGDIQKQWDFYIAEGFPMTDFVLLDGGINDLCDMKTEGFGDEQISKVTDAFCTLIEDIHQANADAHIIYTLIPPLTEWKDEEKGPPSYEVQEHYWKHMNIVASTYDYITVLDLFSINPFRYPCTECYHEFFADSIHLSEAGYRKTFEYIDNILLAQLMKKLSQ